jgi:hypothetical protein
MQCAGGSKGNACIVRCRNTTPAGPFGSCVVVTNAQSAGGASSGGYSTQKPTAETGASPQAVTPAGVAGAVPAALADAIPPIVPEYVASIPSHHSFLT